MRHRPQLQIAVAAALPQLQGLQPTPAGASAASAAAAAASAAHPIPGGNSSGQSLHPFPAGQPLHPLPGGQPPQPPQSAHAVATEAQSAFAQGPRGELDVDLRALASAAAASAGAPPVSVTVSGLMNNTASHSRPLAPPIRAPATLLVNPAWAALSASGVGVSVGAGVGQHPNPLQATAGFPRPPGAPVSGSPGLRPETDLTAALPPTQRPTLFPPAQWEDATAKQRSEQSAAATSNSASTSALQTGAPAAAASAVGAQRDPRQNRAAASRVPASSAAQTAAGAGAGAGVSASTAQPSQSASAQLHPPPHASVAQATTPQTSASASAQPTFNLQQLPLPGLETRSFLGSGGQQTQMIPTYYKAPSTQAFTSNEQSKEATEWSELVGERREEFAEETAAASSQVAPSSSAPEEQSFFRLPIANPQFPPTQQQPMSFVTRMPPPGAFFPAPPSFGPMARPFFRPGFVPPPGAGPMPPVPPHWQTAPRAFPASPMPGRPPFRQPPMPPRPPFTPRPRFSQ